MRERREAANIRNTRSRIRPYHTPQVAISSASHDRGGAATRNTCALPRCGLATALNLARSWLGLGRPVIAAASSAPA